MSQTKKEIDAAFETFQTEYAKFSEKGTKAAGTRARKALNQIAKLSKDLRKEIQDAKNSEE